MAEDTKQPEQKDGDGTVKQNASVDQNDPNKDAKKGPTFDATQVEWVNTHGDTMFGKGYKKAEAESNAKVADLQRQLDELKPKTPVVEKKEDAKSAVAKEPVIVDTAQPDALTKLQAQLAEMQDGMKGLLEQKNAAESKSATLETAHRTTRIKEAFIDAAKTIPFFDPMEVFSLVGTNFDLDDEHGVVVKNTKTGQPRMTMGDSGMRPVTLGEYLNEFASTKTYLVKAQNGDGGSGAGGSQKQPTGKEAKTDYVTMPADDFEASLQSVIGNR